VVIFEKYLFSLKIYSVMKTRIVLFIAALLSSTYAFAGPFEEAITPTEIPVDGGVSLLAVAGVVYGVKKYRDVRKKK
jgi:hypothetical protein